MRLQGRLCKYNNKISRLMALGNALMGFKMELPSDLVLSAA